MLSGYLIFYTQRYKKTIAAASFISRRIMKIIPAKAVVIYSVTILNIIEKVEDNWKIYKEEFYSFLFSSNYYFIHISKDYFHSQDINLLLHFWSLSVEEQFYIFYSFFYIYLYIVLNSNI